MMMKGECELAVTMPPTTNLRLEWQLYANIVKDRLESNDSCTFVFHIMYEWMDIGWNCSVWKDTLISKKKL